MPIYKAVNVSEIINILNELDSDDEADQAITAAKDIDIVYIPPATIGSITDEEDLDDNKINLNDNNDDLMKEIAGSVELQYSLDEGNTQKLGDGYGSLIEEPSTSNTRNNGMERESIKKNRILLYLCGESQETLATAQSQRIMKLLKWKKFFYKLVRNWSALSLLDSSIYIVIFVILYRL